MADNDKPKIRYDDFISNVQPDPAKPESTIMLSGFVGHGPEGHARIYPDPTLGTWYDVPEGDVVHSMPIADSKLGGSYVWVRANAQIKPGSATPPATEKAAEAPQAPAAAAVGIHPTPATLCTEPPGCKQPTPATHCFICPEQHFTPNCTLATVCTQVGCPPPPSVVCTPHGQCPPAPTPASQCIICNVAPTPLTHCFVCPPPVNELPSQAPTHCCQPTPASLCIICNVAPTPLTHCFICPPPVNQLPTQAHTQCCPPQPNTAATVCTRPLGCTFVGCTPHCPGGGFTPATVCTQQVGCQPNGVFTPFGR